MLIKMHLITLFRVMNPHQRYLQAKIENWDDVTPISYRTEVSAHGPIFCRKQLREQFRPPIALRTDLSHITKELWVIPVLRMAH